MWLGVEEKQRLFLFGKLSGLNDKDAALAAGYSLSVAETRNSESGRQAFGPIPSPESNWATLAGQTLFV